MSSQRHLQSFHFACNFTCLSKAISVLLIVKESIPCLIPSLATIFRVDGLILQTYISAFWVCKWFRHFLKIRPGLLNNLLQNTAPKPFPAHEESLEQIKICSLFVKMLDLHPGNNTNLVPWVSHWRRQGLRFVEGMFPHRRLRLALNRYENTF